MTEATQATWTGTGGKMTPAEFGEFLAMAKSHGVRAFKLCDLTVEFGPGSSDLVEQPAKAEPGSPTVAGQWKRGPDLDADPEWD